MSTIFRMLDVFRGIKPKKIVLIGLDAVGKTTIIEKLYGKKGKLTIPTIGWNVETVYLRYFDIDSWDIGGSRKIWKLFDSYFRNAAALIFVVDSTVIRYAKDELQQHLSYELLADIPLLVYANKQDCSNAMGVDEIINELELNLVQNRAWHVQKCSGLTGEGLQEGLDWLLQAVNKN